MSKTDMPQPAQRVMVSSTYEDLEILRQKLKDAILDHGLFPEMMEHNGPGTIAMIDESLGMVAKSAGYICIISQRYGQTPICPQRNPEEKSITELEFDLALRMKLPIVVFIVSDEYPLPKRCYETDAEKGKKLDAFRERAKNMSPDSKLTRLYGEFSSLDDFKDKAASALKKLSSDIERRSMARETEGLPETTVAQTAKVLQPEKSIIPHPPAFYAKSDYLPGHDFVGRKAQCEELSDWASADNPTNLLLFHAIGGNGKSMLTWQWVTRLAPQVRQDWAGRFWYSFYEQGAVMADFCRHALAYMTGRPFEEFRKLKTLQMRDDLLAQLKARPWLLVLDGLERVLVAYHRIDAAELADERGYNPTDAIASRNPRDTIRDEDGDLLRALAQAAPSKILATSRLIPRVLLNKSNRPRPGCDFKLLPGLLEEDAENMFRACGVTGKSRSIRQYLSKSCGNHPLAIGVIAGLVNHYLPGRSNFDAWVSDSAQAARLELGTLDLAEHRNHILNTAIESLPADSAEVLRLLALLSEGVDYSTLEALNPMLPEQMQSMTEPSDPRQVPWFKHQTERTKQRLLEWYQERLVQYQTNQDAHRIWAEAVQAAPRRLEASIQDLEQRGLLQYEQRCYDLHPVVRSVASISASPEQRRRQGEKAVDHFTAQLHRPFGKIETLEELAPAIHAIRVYLKLGMSERAAEMYANKGVGFALRFNLEAYNEILELLRPLFPNGWGRRPEVDDEKAAFLAAAAGDAFLGKHHFADAEQAYSTAIMAALSAEDWPFLKRMIGSFSVLENDRFSLCRAWRLYCLLCAFEQAYNQSGCETFDTFSGMILIAAKIGSLELVTEYKNKFGSEWTNDSRGQLYGAGLLFWQDQDPRLQIEGALLSAEEIQDRFAIRNLLDLRGLWHARKEEWLQARDAFEEAVHLARERNLSDAISETGLALAKYHLGQLPEVEEEVERLAQLRRTNHYNLALLCKAIGDLAQAKHHARAAYKQYWGDGEPYVFRYWLERTIELLHQLGEPIPQLPPFDPAKVQPYPWEAEVQAAIDRLNAEKAAKAASAAADEGADSAQED